MNRQPNYNTSQFDFWNLNIRSPLGSHCMSTATRSFTPLPSYRQGQSRIPIPYGAIRERRYGGHIMTHKTAEEWAARILGEQELDRTRAQCAEWYINQKIKSQYRVKLSTIGDDPNNPYCMIVTHLAPFRGYVGMPPSDVPQFTPNEADVIARQVLLDEGVSESDFEFQMWIG